MERLRLCCRCYFHNIHKLYSSLMEAVVFTLACCSAFSTENFTRCCAEIANLHNAASCCITWDRAMNVLFFFFCLSWVFVWCAQIIRLHKVESGTLCIDNVPQGAEPTLLALPTRSFARLFEVKRHFCDNSKEIVSTYFCHIHLSLTNEGSQP